MKNHAERVREICEGFTLFREGLSGRLQKTGTLLRNDFLLPVNNFIKDIAQIEREFEAERKRNSEFCLCIGGAMIPADEVQKMPMEENY